MKVNNTTDYIGNLDKMWENKQCPICKKSNWLVQENVYELPEYHGGGVVIGSGRIFPVVPIMCRECGYTFFMNAFLSNAVAPDQKENVEGENGSEI